VVAETPTDVPFAIARMFTLRAPKMAERGKHAHRACSQLMLCVNGAASVVCDDGDRTRTFQLDRTNFGLLVPPSIWNTVTFREENSVVVVLCDRPFEESDYLRYYEDFVAFRQAADR
jgi:dTDP-4-dehydrorhamnose 3,5-epimerase-like enzyme